MEIDRIAFSSLLDIDMKLTNSPLFVFSLESGSLTDPHTNCILTFDPHYMNTLEIHEVFELRDSSLTLNVDCFKEHINPDSQEKTIDTNM